MIEVWLIVLGFAAGALGSIIGIGGGAIIVPALIWAGFPPVLAASNSLFAVFGNAAASSASYHLQKRIEYRTGLALGLAAVPGTIAGAYASKDAAPEVFGVLFGIVLAASAAYVMLGAKMRPAVRSAAIAAVLAALASFGAGVISSYFGIGGGVVFVPIMIVMMGMQMKRAAPTSQFALLFASFAGMMAHGALGHPDIYQALFLAIGAAAGGLAGSRILPEIKERRLRIMAAIILGAIALKMIADGIGL